MSNRFESELNRCTDMLIMSIKKLGLEIDRSEAERRLIKYIRSELINVQTGELYESVVQDIIMRIK